METCAECGKSWRGPSIFAVGIDLFCSEDCGRVVFPHTFGDVADEVYPEDIGIIEEDDGK